MRTLLFALLACALVHAAEVPRTWGLPSEVFKSKSSKMPIPLEVVRSPSGAVGVFAFSKDDKLAFATSKDGRAPWKTLTLPIGVTGGTRVAGTRVEAIVTDFEAQKAAFVAFDIETCAEVERSALPGKFPSMPMFSSVVANAKDRFALVACERGEVFVSSSEDEGRTWSDPVQAFAEKVEDDAVAPPLFLAADGLHLVAVGKAGTLDHLVSADRGKTWAPGAAPDLGKDVKGVLAAGAQSGKGFHVVCLAESGAYVHVGSADDGKTWTKPVAVAKTDGRKDAARIFNVRAAGDVVAFCCSDPGERGVSTTAGHVFLSHDAGATWSESPVTEGIDGKCGFPVVTLAGNGDAWAVFGRGPGNGVGKNFVLFRRLLDADAPREEIPEGAEVPEWWKGGK